MDSQDSPSNSQEFTIDDAVLYEDGTQPLEDVLIDDSSQVQSQHQPQDQNITHTLPPINTGAISSTYTQELPSPVPTEPEDPDHDFILNQLASHNVKVYDFAFPSSDNHNASQIPLTPEIFDPYTALGEFEFRLGQRPRTFPVPGKTLRRLIEVGWVGEDEAMERCDAEDLKALEEFDERNRIRKEHIVSSNGNKSDGGVRYRPDGSYPYLTLSYTHIPTIAEREGLANSVRILYSTVDRVVRTAMAMEQQREQERLDGAHAEKERKRIEEERRLQQERENESERNKEEAKRMVGAWVTSSGRGPGTTVETHPSTTDTTSRKRSPHQAWAEEGLDGTNEDEDSEAKRLRLAKSTSETWYHQLPGPSRAQSQGHIRSLSQPQPPEKQYPAPLSAYDPQLYPDAASVIESQSQSQGRRPYRHEEGTPPLDEGKESGQEKEGQEQEQDEQEDTRPNALKRSPKKALKRSLTRGRTLVQIC